jgi:predicted Zn-dependent peptidase
LQEVWAAWNEVPQPTTATRPSGSRRPTGTWASHSGWAATVALIFSPAMAPSIPCDPVGVFERFSLQNGLRVLTAPMPHAQSVSCFVMLAAGSRYETADTNGIAHFAEHMFFKGTDRRPTARDIAGEIDAIGGEFNAFTGKEYTGYYVRCAAATRDTALDVLVDMLRNSRFDPDEIEREKGVIIEEMNMYFDTPRDFIGGVYESLLYGDQPLGWDIIGRKETVRGATRESFTDYTEKWYRPDRMVVGVGGQLGTGLQERLEQLVGDMEPRETGSPAPVASNGSGSRVKVHTKQSDQAHVVLGVRSRPLVDPDRYVLQILATVLGGGMSSRLFTEVRERRGLAYYVFGTNHAYTDAGSLYAQSGVDINRIDDAVTTIVEQFRLLADAAVPSDELEKARNFTKGRFVLQLESPHGTIMFGMRREVLEGRVEEPQAVLDALDSVTAEGVQRVAKEILDSGFHLAVIGPFDDAARFEQLIG